jgi:polyisoprenoid-binding protein YceI
MKKILLLILCGMSLSAMVYSQETYTLDKNHARLSFSALHMGISNVEGIFKSFDATFVSSKADFSDAKIGMTADVKSISTEVEMRDNDLRDNWFEVSKFPTMTFVSTTFKKVSGKNYLLLGDITIHGVTKPIVFNVVFNGKGQNPFSKAYSYGFTITGKLKRSEFGIGKETIPTVSDVISLKSNVEFLIK